MTSKLEWLDKAYDLIEKMPKADFLEVMKSAGYKVERMTDEEITRCQLENELAIVRSQIEAFTNLEKRIIEKIQTNCKHNWKLVGKSDDDDGWSKRDYLSSREFKCTLCDAKKEEVSKVKKY